MKKNFLMLSSLLSSIMMLSAAPVKKNATQPNIDSFYNVFSKNFTFLNIIPCEVGTEKQQAAQIIDYVKRTGNKVVLYCLTLHPEGNPAIDKPKKLIESYRALKGYLANTDVKLGILLQAILGHWPRVDKDIEAWTRSVDINGRMVRFCPLDKNFRQYIYDVVVMLAKENPVFIMGDDDIRSFSPEAECFCQLHTNLFNKRSGKNFTSQEYQEAVKAASPKDETYKIYEKLRQEISLEVATLIRKAIDSVNPAIPGGACLPSREVRTYTPTAKAFAANNHPAVLRLCNGNYLEFTSKSFLNSTAKTMALKEVFPEILYLLDEGDTFPHSLFSRSSKSMHAKFCSSIFTGLKGAKIWYVNCNRYSYPVHQNYTKVLEKYQHFYQTLAGEVAKTSYTGVVIPCRQDYTNWHSGIKETQNNFLWEPTFGTKTFGLNGIPYYVSHNLNSDAIYAIAGSDCIAGFSDNDLKKLLSGKLLVDGPAAAAICARGFAKELGVNAQLIDFQYNQERDAISKKRLPMSKAAGVPYFTLLDKNAEVLTNLCFSAYSTSLNFEEVSPATVISRNHLEGTISSTAFHQNINTFLGHGSRKDLYIKILDKLNGKAVPLVCTNLQDITVLTRKYQNDSLLALVCNLNFDDLQKITFRCVPMPKKVFQLMPNGKWKKCNFKKEKNTITIPANISCYDLMVLKFE